MTLKIIPVILLLLLMTSAAFSECIEKNSFFESRTTCRNYSCCGWYNSGYGDFCIKNCSGACDKKNTSWSDCLEECEPGTCPSWSSVSRSGREICDLKVCIEWDPKTTLCVDSECADEAILDEVYNKCGNPVCNKSASLGPGPRIGRRQFPETVLFYVL